MTTTLYSRVDSRLGRFALRPVDPGADARVLHGWLTHPKSVFWMMIQLSLAEIEDHFVTVAAAKTHDAFLGLHEDEPAFLVERYDPRYDPVGETYPVQPGDVGMHFLLPPAERSLRGFSRAVLVTVMDALFAHSSTRRVVVEPDVRNKAVHVLNAAVGFQVQATVSLPGKQALLSTCTREEYLTARKAL